MKYSELQIGDMFNTKPARWVKINKTHAICVMSNVFPIGRIVFFDRDYDVVLLYGAS